MIKYCPGKKNIVTNVLSQKESPYIDNGRQFMILPKDCLKEGVYLTYLAPIYSEEVEIIGIIKRIK